MDANTLNKNHIKEYEEVIKKLEIKYLGEETRWIPDDKYFRMLLHGMTKEEAKQYSKAKIALLKFYHVY